MPNGKSRRSSARHGQDPHSTGQVAFGSIIYTRGTHNIKVGASLIRRQLLSLQSNQPGGLWNFQGYPTLIQGLYFTVSRNINLFPPHFRVWETGAYVSDNWRVNNRLTLNLGLRYDVYTPYAEIHNHASTFDPKTGALLVAGVNGVSNTAGLSTDYRGVEPRLGAAFDAGHGLVIRGAYGLTFFPMNTTSTADLKNPPFVSSALAFVCRSGNRPLLFRATRRVAYFVITIPTGAALVSLVLSTAVSPPSAWVCGARHVSGCLAGWSSVRRVRRVLAYPKAHSPNCRQVSSMRVLSSIPMFVFLKLWRWYEASE